MDVSSYSGNGSNELFDSFDKLEFLDSLNNYDGFEDLKNTYEFSWHVSVSLYISWLAGLLIGTLFMARPQR